MGAEALILPPRGCAERRSARPHPSVGSHRTRTPDPPRLALLPGKTDLPGRDRLRDTAIGSKLPSRLPARTPASKANLRALAPSRGLRTRANPDPPAAGPSARGRTREPRLLRSPRGGASSSPRTAGPLIEAEASRPDPWPKARPAEAGPLSPPSESLGARALRSSSGGVSPGRSRSPGREPCRPCPGDGAIPASRADPASALPSKAALAGGPSGPAGVPSRCRS